MKVYRNAFYGTSTNYTKVLASANTGTTDNATDPSVVSGYTLAGYASAASTNTITYADLAAIKNSTATSAYAVFSKSESENATFYYSTSTAGAKGNTTASGTKTTYLRCTAATTAATDVTHGSCTIPTISETAPSGTTRVTNWATSASSMSTSSITCTTGSSYYAVYRSTVTIYYPSSESAATNKKVYRNAYYGSSTNYTTVLAGTTTGTSDNATDPSVVSGYTLAGYANARNTNTITYADLAAIKTSTATSAYAVFSKSESENATFYYSTSTAGAKGNTTASGTKTTYLTLTTSNTVAGTSVVHGSCTIPTISETAPSGTTRVTNWATSASSMSTSSITCTTGSSYYAVYRSTVTIYYPSSATAATNMKIYRNAFYGTGTNYTKVLASATTGTTDNATDPSVVSGYSLAGYASAYGTNTIASADLAAIKNSTATSAYALFSATASENATFYYSTSTAGAKGNTTASGTKTTYLRCKTNTTAETNVAHGSCTTPTINDTVPEGTSSVGWATNDPSTMSTSTITCTTGASYYKVYRGSVVITTPTSTSASSSTTVYRNAFYGTATNYTKVLATANTGTTDNVSLPTAPSGYSFAGFANAASTNTITYAGLSNVRDSSASQVYTVFSKSESENATFYYSTSTAGAKGNTTASGTKTTYLRPTSATAAGTSVVHGSCTTPTSLTGETAPTGTTRVTGWVTNDPSSMSAGSITCTTGSSYYAVYRSTVTIYKPSSTSACNATNTTFYRNAYYGTGTNYTRVLATTNTGTSTNASYTSGVSGYSLAGFATSSSTNTISYTNISDLVTISSTTLYAVLSKTENENATLNYSNSIAGAKTSTTASGTKTTYLRCTSNSAAGTNVVHGTCTFPSSISGEVAPYGTSSVGFASGTSTMSTTSTCTTGSTYYKVYRSNVTNYYYSSSYTSRTLYRNIFLNSTSATSYTAVLSTTNTGTSNYSTATGPSSAPWVGLVGDYYIYSQTSGSMTITLTDKNNNPVSNANVSLMGASSSLGTTNANGQYSFNSTVLVAMLQRGAIEFEIEGIVSYPVRVKGVINGTSSTFTTGSEIVYFDAPSTIAAAAASSDTTLYTIYKYNVSYQKGSNVSAIGKSSDSCYMTTANNDCVVLLPSITPNSGYVSVGWNTTSGARTGTAAGSSYIITNNTTTLYANALIGNYQNTSTSAYYETLNEAFSAVSNSQTIKVLQNVTETTAASLASGKTGVKLDLNGKTLTLDNVGITNGGTLDIYNTSSTTGTLTSNANNVITNNGTLTLNGTSATNKIIIAQTARDTINNSAILNSSSKSLTINNKVDIGTVGLYGINNYGTLNMTGGSITTTGNSSNSGIANSGTATISGATILGKTYGVSSSYNSTLTVSGSNTNISSSGSGWAISNNGGTATINAGTIQGSTAGIINSPATVSGVSYSATLYINGGTITGDIGLSNSGSATISAGSIQASTDKGISNALSGNITMTGGTVTGYLYGIHNTSTGTINISGSSTEISAIYYGINLASSIYTEAGTINVNGGTVTSSNTYGIYINNNSASVSVGGATVSTTSKNAVYLPKGSFSISSGTVTATSATAISSSTGSVSISGGSISGTYGISNTSASITMTSGTITATTMGISNISGTLVVKGGTITGGNRGIHNGASGTVTLGDNSNSVNTSTPYIKSTGTDGRYGLYNASGGTFNFYDGLIEAASGTGYSIYGTVSDTPTGYSVKKYVSNGSEYASLAKALVQANALGGTIPTTTGWANESGNKYALKGVENTYGTLPTPTLSGYAFDGWYLNLNKVINSWTDGAGINGSTGAFETTWTDYMATSDLIPVKGGKTLYSNVTVCGIYSYDSSKNFIGRESNYATTHTISSNAAYIRIEVKKDVYSFDWLVHNLMISEISNQASVTGINEKVTSSTAIASIADHSIYASWKKTYTMTFDRNGGTSVSPTSMSTGAGIVYNNLPTPTWNSSHPFQGWYAAFNGNTSVNMGRQYMYDDKLSVHFSAFNALWGASSGTLISCTEGAGWEILFDNTRFSVWVYDRDTGYKIIYSTVNMSTFKPGWHDFDIVFNGTNVKFWIDGSLQSTSESFTSGKIGYHPTNVLLLGAEASGGTSPAGSYFSGNIGNLVISNSDQRVTSSTLNSFSGPNQSITLYAHWQYPLYQVILNNQSANTSGTTSLWYRYNEMIYYTSADTSTWLSPSSFAITKPTKSGKLFNGYYTSTSGGGTIYINMYGVMTNSLYSKHPSQINSSYTDTITLYANWVSPTVTQSDVWVVDGGAIYTGDHIQRRMKMYINYSVTKQDNGNITGTATVYSDIVDYSGYWDGYIVGRFHFGNQVWDDYYGNPEVLGTTNLNTTLTTFSGTFGTGNSITFYWEQGGYANYNCYGTDSSVYTISFNGTKSLNISNSIQEAMISNMSDIIMDTENAIKTKIDEIVNDQTKD